MSDLEMFLHMLNGAQVNYRVVHRGIVRRGKASPCGKTHTYVELPSIGPEVIYFAFTREGKLNYWGADES